MKRVVVAIGYNPMVEKLAKAGLEYARALDAELCIVNVIADVSHFSMEYSPLTGFEGFSPDCAFKNLVEQVADANRFLQAVVRYLDEDHSIQTKVLEGNPADAILDFVAEYQADLLIIGEHQRRMMGLASGDTVAELLGRARVPVLVVPGGKPLKSKAMQSREFVVYT